MRYMRLKSSNNSLEGFTLLEMLIVTVILAVISLPIYSTFNNGMKIFQRVNEGSPHEDLNIILDRFTTDVRNSLIFNGLKFSGSENSLQLVTLVKTPWVLRQETVGRASYFYDAKSGLLSREQADISELYQRQVNPRIQSIGNIKSLQFRYYLYDPAKNEYFWQGQWPTEGLPLAVRIELEFGDATQTNKFTRTVNIPISG